jgi:hypothetical protein
MTTGGGNATTMTASVADGVGACRENAFLPLPRKRPMILLPRMRFRLALSCAVAGAMVASIPAGRPARAYVEIPYTLGRLINESTHVTLMAVEKIDRERNLIIYRKVKDIKGTHPTDVIRHNIGRGGFHPREWQTIMAWAQEGKHAVFCHNGGASETCIDNYWYQAYAGGDWWGMSHAEPYLLRTYAGKPERLATAVASMLQGNEVVVPCMVDGDKNALQLAQAKVQRLKASLKITEYNVTRDFVGWGGNEDFRLLAGMPGFSHIGSIGRVDPQASGIAAADFDGDGKTDLCLYGASRVVLLQNGGNSFNEVSLPYTGGARSADWADYNGDGRPDLLLATAAGPRLFTNAKEGFKNDSAGLPHEPYYNITSAAWIEYDGDRRPDILLANGFRGLRLYRNLGPEGESRPTVPVVGPWYVCGPFDNSGQRGFDIAYPPEKSVDLKATYDGKGGQKVGWREGKFVDGQPNNLMIFRPEHNVQCVAYLYREFNFPSAADLPISLGSDDTLTVWLNGEKLLAENVYRGVAPDQNQLTLRLKPGKNSLLLKICQGDGDFAFYYAARGVPLAVTPLFEDASEKAGLGPEGAGSRVKGDRLAVADVNGDGRDDFLYSAGTGLLVLGSAKGYVESPASGLRYRAGRVTPVFGDYDGDGRLDLFVPQGSSAKLFRGDGQGRFTDVTASSGEAAGPFAGAVGAAWADVDGKGRLDLWVACQNGPNRFLRNLGGGRFGDAGEEIGLYQRTFNSRGVLALDLNKDGALDLVFNNEGQDSAVLLGAGAAGNMPAAGGGP